MTNEKISALSQLRQIYDFFSSISRFSKLIPEVRTNISVALPNAQKKDDIAAIEGRITIIGGFPKACGNIKFGVSDHTARLLLAAKKFNNDINIVMNLKYSEDLINKIQDRTTLSIFEIMREKQPNKIQKKEYSTMQWLIKSVVKEVGEIPDIIWDRGAKGKEPMIRLFSDSGENMIKKLELLRELL